MPSATKVKPAKAKGGKKAQEGLGRAVKYPQVETVVCKGDDAVTVEFAKKLLGWQSEEDYINEETEGMDKEAKAKVKGVEFGKDYLLTDVEGSKVRCLNNLRNRPFSQSWALELAQSILNKQQKFNGESIIIGKTELVLSAQHRLIGLVLANQIWEGKGNLKKKEGDQSDHWKEKWPTPPVWEGVVVFGVDEDEETVHTLTMSDLVLWPTCSSLTTLSSARAVQRSGRGCALLSTSLSGFCGNGLEPKTMPMLRTVLTRRPSTGSDGTPSSRTAWPTFGVWINPHASQSLEERWDTE